MDLTLLRDLAPNLSGLPGGALPLLLLLAAAGLFGLSAILALRARRGAGPGLGMQATDGCVFLFSGRELRGANDAAEALLGALGSEGTAFGRLVRWLGGEAADLAFCLEELTARSEPFARAFAASDGRYLEIRGETRGALTALILRDSTAARRAQLEAEARVARLEGEAEALRDVADTVPVPLWVRRPGGQIVWCNPAYRAEAGLVRSGSDEPAGFLFGALSEALAGQGGDLTARRRLALSVPGGERRWFDVAEEVVGDGRIAGSAIGVDQVVRAEAALKRFVETLTETFAHLPIGLAVFDKNRRLGLFNPAISEILKLDPAWLAARPSLRDFLEHLRENRQMPDQKDFVAWRRKLTALERDAEAASYEEDWVLPSGQTLQVIGRPHPQGAIAFLFEDISAAVMLERRYRSEIDLYRGILHKQPEALAVFGADGTLAYANTAFRGVWGFEPGLGETAPHISRLIERWSELSAPGAPWRDLRDFATGRESRSAWTARIALCDGRALRARFAPLPEGFTLCGFADESERERRETALRERAALLERAVVRADSQAEGAEDRLDQGLSTLARLAERAGEAGQGALRDQMMDILADLRFRLAMRESPPARGELPPAPAVAVAEETTGQAAATPTAPPDAAPHPGSDAAGPDPVRSAFVRLQDAAAARTIMLDLSGVEGWAAPGLPAPRLAQIAQSLGLEALALARDGGRVVVQSRAVPGGLALSAEVPDVARAEGGEPGMAGALLRRMVQAQGGEVQAGADASGSGCLIACFVPVPEPGSATPGLPRAAQGG